MNCLCAKREPCPIHKDKPLEMPDVQNHHCYVINVYSIWSTKQWFATVTKDAIRTHKTDKHDSKLKALMAAWVGVGKL